MIINERINKIREHFCKGDNTAFAQILGKAPQYVSNLCNNGKKVGNKVLNEILMAFPAVNPIWLKLGEGEMLKGNVESSQKRETIAIDKEAWEVIRLQAKSLERKDAQVDELIQIIKDREKIYSKDVPDAGCVVAKVSSDE